MDGLAGNDIIKAAEGDDTVLGGSGNDYIYGEDGDDVLDGEEGNDYLFGGNGNDTLKGGAGDDVLSGGNGADIYLFEKVLGMIPLTIHKMIWHLMPISLNSEKESCRRMPFCNARGSI